MTIPLAERIVAVAEAIAGERKAMALLDMPGLPVPDRDGQRRRVARRIAALEVVLADLYRAAGSAPPEGAAA